MAVIDVCCRHRDSVYVRFQRRVACPRGYAARRPFWRLRLKTRRCLIPLPGPEAFGRHDGGADEPHVVAVVCQEYPDISVE